MNVFSAMEVVASGLAAQRTRLNVVSSNLANAQTTRTDEGGPFQRKDVLFKSESINTRFREMLNNDMARSVQGVRVTEIVSDNAPPRMVYDPQHADANAEGYVAFPDISIVEEMVNMMMAQRAYEAGSTAMQAITSTAQAALRLGDG
jgi:flagellar basal-body rod protein FlgC